MSKKSQIVIDTYNKIANEYNKEYGNDYSDTPYIDMFLNSLNGKDVLDIGSGLGNLTNYIYEKGFNVTAIDLSDEMIKLAKKNYSNIEFIKMDMKNINLNKQFDGISLLYSLFHLTKEEVKEVLPKYHKILKNNGKMLIILQDGQGEQVVNTPLNKELLMFVNYYSLEEITNILNKNNFKIINYQYKIEQEESLSNKKIVILCEKV